MRMLVLLSGPFSALTRARMCSAMLGALVSIILVCCIGPTATDAATLVVASNGIDSVSCGGMNTPCRSIRQAITNAFDGDRIVVGPGSYGPAIEGIEASGGGPSMIHVVKSLTIESRDGAGVTILDVGGADAIGVLIDASQVVFGKKNNGFTIADARRYGLIPGGSTTNVDVQGNVAIGNGSNGNPAFQIQGIGHTVIGNKAVNNANVGFSIGGENHTVSGNVASGNLQGFGLFFSGSFTRNASIGNRFDGVAVNVPGLSLVISDNVVISNGQRGLAIQHSFSGTITKNNIFGNVGCGLDNQSDGGVVNAPSNFWGAPSGPGPDPADEVCNASPSTTIIDPVASKEFNIRVEAGQ